jgi:hypothetical protein
MQQDQDTVIEELIEQIISNGLEEMTSVFPRLFVLAIHMERKQFLCAGDYEPVFWRLCNANGYKSKRVDTPAGTLSLSVPKTTDHLEKGVRRTILCAISGTGVGL